MAKKEILIDNALNLNRSDERQKRSRIVPVAEIHDQSRVEEPAKPKQRAKVSVKYERPKSVNLKVDEETNRRLDTIKYLHGIEKQDISYVALCEFLKRYANPDGSLTQEGLELLK